MRGKIIVGICPPGNEDLFSSPAEPERDQCTGVSVRRRSINNRFRRKDVPDSISEFTGRKHFPDLMGAGEYRHRPYRRRYRQDPVFEPSPPAMQKIASERDNGTSTKPFGNEHVATLANAHECVRPLLLF